MSILQTTYRDLSSRRINQVAEQNFSLMTFKAALTIVGISLMTFKPLYLQMWMSAVGHHLHVRTGVHATTRTDHSSVDAQ